MYHLQWLVSTDLRPDRRRLVSKQNIIYSIVPLLGFNLIVFFLTRLVVDSTVRFILRAKVCLTGYEPGYVTFRLVGYVTVRLADYVTARLTGYGSSCGILYGSSHGLRYGSSYGLRYGSS